MNDQEEFTKIYHQYHNKIYRFLIWRTGNLDLAEEIVSETFLHAWQKWKKFNGLHAQAWLFRIARNLLIDFWRKKQVIPLEEVSEFTNIQDSTERQNNSIDQKEEFKQVRDAIKKLSELQQSVIILRYIEELNTSETAAILKISEGNVRIVQYRALKALRKQFEESKIINTEISRYEIKSV